MSSKIPLIVDCDPGTDDAVALWLALASPELDVLAITVAGGNVGLANTLSNALSIVEVAGSSIPVFAGADRSLMRAFSNETRVHGENGLGGIQLPPPGGTPSSELASDAIRRIVRSASRPVTLVGIGPVTNIGLALASEPAIVANLAEIVLMTGAWGEGNITASAEFNAFNDPEALAIVLAAGCPVTLAPLELTAQALVSPTVLDVLRQAGPGNCLHLACDIMGTRPPVASLGNLGAPLHDPCAIAWLIRPDLFTGRACAVTVELSNGACRGRTVINRWTAPHGTKNARVLETLDGEKFFAILGERLARLP